MDAFENLCCTNSSCPKFHKRTSIKASKIDLWEKAIQELSCPACGKKTLVCCYKDGTPIPAEFVPRISRAQEAYAFAKCTRPVDETEENALRFHLRIGDASREDILELYSSLSELHRANGGFGIIIQELGSAFHQHNEVIA